MTAYVIKLNNGRYCSRGGTVTTSLLTARFFNNSLVDYEHMSHICNILEKYNPKIITVNIEEEV